MDRKILLSTSYFGPVQYFSKYLFSGNLIIENHENFIKQTYRNRCIIAGANGPIKLTVPVLRGSFHKTAINELEIDYSKRWQDIHWRTIESAYRSAPFFDYYEEEIKSVLKKQTQFLIEYNTELTSSILSILDIEPRHKLSNRYHNITSNNEDLDYRELIRPKNIEPDILFEAFPYHQVFEEKLGFIPNLSILDLIFNAGPESIEILQSSITHRV